MKNWIKENGHPRGALGMKHTVEAKAIISKKSRANWQDPAYQLNSPEAAQRKSDLMIKRILEGSMNQGYSRSRGGKREDLGGVYFRSAWEANYARYLNWLKSRTEIKDWEYEPKTFVFGAIQRGTRAYTPDFKVTNNSGSHEWHEVKGWMDAKSKTRLSRFAKYYPEEKLILVGADWFKSANKNKLGAIVSPHWESGTTR